MAITDVLDDTVVRDGCVADPPRPGFGDLLDAAMSMPFDDLNGVIWDLYDDRMLSWSNAVPKITVFDAEENPELLGKLNTSLAGIASFDVVFGGCGGGHTNAAVFFKGNERGSNTGGGVVTVFRGPMTVDVAVRCGLVDVLVTLYDIFLRLGEDGMRKMRVAFDMWKVEGLP